MTTLPGLICWYLGSAVIYTKKLWHDSEVVCGSLSGQLGIRQANKLRGKGDMEVRKIQHKVDIIFGYII